MRLVAVARRPRDRQAPLDRADRGRVGRLGRRLPRRRRAAARLDAVRPVAVLPARAGAARGAAERRRVPGHVRVSRRAVDAVGDAVALPHGDRRGARSPRAGARDVRVPLPGGRVGVRALRGAPHGVPARLPRGLRLPHAARAGTRRALPARARRPAAGARGQARRGHAQAARGLRAGAGAAADSREPPPSPSDTCHWR